MRFFRVSLVIFLSFLLNNVSIAKDPSDLINDIVNEAASVLKSSDPVESKIIKLNDIAERSVDIDGIGMYALGKHKKTMSDEQKIKYKKLFKSYFLKSFSSRLSEYTNPEIDVQNKEVLNEKYTIVNSILKATKERPEIKIDWRVYTKDPNNPLIRDLIIEGLSLARTQKEEFASILNSNNNDINALFKVLKEFSQE